MKGLHILSILLEVGTLGVIVSQTFINSDGSNSLISNLTTPSGNSTSFTSVNDTSHTWELLRGLIMCMGVVFLIGNIFIQMIGMDYSCHHIRPITISRIVYGFVCMVVIISVFVLLYSKDNVSSPLQHAKYDIPSCNLSSYLFNKTFSDNDCYAIIYENFRTSENTDKHICCASAQQTYVNIIDKTNILYT